MDECHFPSRLRKTCLLQLFLLPSLASAQGLIGPLTTTFSPPVTCYSLTAWFYTSGSETIQQLYIGDADPGLKSDNPCLPSGYNSALSTLVNQYYSPGICPSNWATVSAFVTTSSETVGICCPTSYGLAGEPTGFCICTLEVGTSTVAVAYGYNEIPATTARPLTTGTIAVGGNNVNAVALQVRWRANDVVPIQPLTSSQTSSRSQASSRIQTLTGSENLSRSQTLTGHETSGGSQTLTSSQTNSALPVHSPALDHGLSREAKIGIGIGIPLAFLSFAGFLAGVFVWRFSQQQRQEEFSGEPISELHDIPATKAKPHVVGKQPPVVLHKLRFHSRNHLQRLYRLGNKAFGG